MAYSLQLALVSAPKLNLESREYPSLLKEITGPPKVLYYRGNLDLIKEPFKLAMVGTRHPTYYGKSSTQKLAQALSERGICVVSGMALGIDSAAHEAVLKNGGKTIAVLGHGLDFPVQPFQRAIFAQIVQKGLVLSEYEPGQAPAQWTYPKRNRIIAGLCQGTIVIEGRNQSGAMITGKQAVDFNREVFALPGMMGTLHAEGPHWLIQHGAKLIHSVADIFNEFGMTPATARSLSDLNIPEELRPLVLAIGFEAVSIETICGRTQLPITALAQKLLQLELMGLIEELPGKNYRLL